MSQLLLQADSRRLPFAADSIDCVVCSPPYWNQRDYGSQNQIGLEASPENYLNELLKVFREVHRVLKSSGTLWLNLGDAYCSNGRYDAKYEAKHPDRKSISGRNWAAKYGTNPRKGFRGGLYKLKAKDLVGMPWRVALALQQDGWWLRSDIIWAKTVAKPERVTDRPKNAHEYIFLLTKSANYYYQSDNSNSVWTLPTERFPQGHFATYSEQLVERCLRTGCPPDGIVLDPFVGSGTTLRVCKKLGLKGVGTDLNSDYLSAAKNSLANLNPNEYLDNQANHRTNNSQD